MVRRRSSPIWPRDRFTPSSRACLMPLWDRNRCQCGKPSAMKIEILRAKLHQACITQADVDYEGSLGIDIELMEAVGMYPYEKVLVANMNNGSRLETYAIPEPFGFPR